MLGFILVMVPLVFVINGVSKNDWLQALLFAVAVAVGLTPEMLLALMCDAARSRRLLAGA